MSRRTLRIGELIRDILAEAISNRLSDPRIERLTSITRVEVVPDLSLARVYLSIFASAARRRSGLAAIRRAAGKLRAILAGELSIRKVPQLDFRLDDSLQKTFETVMAVERAAAEYQRDNPAEPHDQDDEAEGPAAQVEAQSVDTSVGGGNVAADLVDGDPAGAAMTGGQLGASGASMATDSGAPERDDAAQPAPVAGGPAPAISTERSTAGRAGRDRELEDA